MIRGIISDLQNLSQMAKSCTKLYSVHPALGKHFYTENLHFIQTIHFLLFIYFFPNSGISWELYP